MNETTEKQLDMLRHMLGINDPAKRVPKPYRNYAAVNPDDPLFVEMDATGLVERYEANCPGSDYHWYRCTDGGRIAAMRSFRKIQYSPAKRRYIAYLSVSDVCPDLTFRQFLTNPRFSEARRA